MEMWMVYLGLLTLLLIGAAVGLFLRWRRELASAPAAVAEAELVDDATVAARFGVRPRDVARWRAQAKTDPKFAEAVRFERGRVRRAWALELAESKARQLRSLDSTSGATTSAERT